MLGASRWLAPAVPGFAAAVAAGATPVADATDGSWGGRSAFVADPEGNRWEIAWAPGIDV